MKFNKIFLILFFNFLFFNYACSSIKDAQSSSNTIIIQPNKKISDNTLFKNAFNTNTNNKNTIIIVKKGKYNISEIISTKFSNQTLSFEEGATIYFKDENSGFLILNDNYTVENGTFIGNGIDAKNFYRGFAFMLYGVKNVIIKNSTFSNLGGNTIFMSFRNDKGCEKCTIQNNTIIGSSTDNKKNNKKCAILLGYSGSGYEHNDNIITGNNIDGKNLVGMGIAFIGHGHRNTISNNTIQNCLSYGIMAYESQSEEGALSYTYITNNLVKNIGETGDETTVFGMGIYLMKSQNSIISGNKVYNTMRNSNKTETLPAGAIALNGSSYTTVSNNVIANSYMYGIANAYGFNTEFKNNTISDIRKSGIYLMNVNDNSITENTFKDIGEVVIKGAFASTKNKNYAAGTISKFKNISTGKNIKVEDNTFYSPVNVLYFTGKDKQADPVENKITNNSFENNKIYSPKKSDINQLVNFRQEVKNTNRTKNNTITE